MQKMIPAVCVICFTILLSAYPFRAAAEDFTNVISPPYYMVHYKGSTNEGELKLPVTYTLWLPPGVKTLRGIIVHQHGCGVSPHGDGAAAACDLHWQALARKHGCALLGPEYQQFDKTDCLWWCNPRNGSGTKFLQALADLAELSHHPELKTVPWALWGHSGGALWVGTMFFLYPDRTAAVWLRSQVPPQPIGTFPAAAFAVPVMCNLGTQEGVTVKTNASASSDSFERKVLGMWGRVEPFFKEFRAWGGLIGVSVDPNSGHDCGNSRYLAIPWFDACLTARLPKKAGDARLKPMPAEDAWLAPLLGRRAQPAAKFTGDVKTAVWLPNERVAKAWGEYEEDGNVRDTTPPPAPTNVRVNSTGELSWEAEADLESGLAAFIVERDGRKLARVPETYSGYFVGRPVFQQTGYGDTPTPPLAEMRYKDDTAEKGQKHTYTVRTVNSVGLESKPAVAMTSSSEERCGNALPCETVMQWLEVPQPIPIKPHVAIKLDTKLLDACVGNYEFAPYAGGKATIQREGDQLQVRLENGPKTALDIYPMSETNFFLKIDDSLMTFIKNDKGEVTGVIHHTDRAGGWGPPAVGKKIKD
jgi:pimeloyl-ACP methyl ester carboxylesterase